MQNVQRGTSRAIRHAEPANDSADRCDYSVSMTLQIADENQRREAARIVTDPLERRYIMMQALKRGQAQRFRSNPDL